LSSIEMRTFERRNLSVQGKDVNWLPWSVFIMSGATNLWIA